MLSRLHLVVLIASTSLAACEMPKAREAMLLFLPISFGYKLYGYLKERRAPRYVFGLSSAEVTKMMSEPKAKRLNWWRHLFKRDALWERRGRTPTKPANHRTPRNPHRPANPRAARTSESSSGSTGT
ncbi:MAG: hypothetical protein ACJA1R_003138 [Flavobacteriales bacterium]|jgi:hypothetical protein